MKTIKFLCPHCQKAVEYTKSERVLNFFTQFFVTIFIALGIIFLIFLYFNGVTHTFNQASGIHYTYNALQYHDEVRLLAINITKDCSGDDYGCYARELFENMSNIKYVPDSNLMLKDYSPLVVYEYGDDCEGLAQMYVSFAKSVGVPASVVCSTDHCVAVVHLQKDVVIDLTVPVAYYLHENETFTDLDVCEIFRRSIWGEKIIW